MNLKTVVSKLNKFAPTSLAEKWDNVGLLVEPSAPHTVSRILLTNDLTEPVLEEAVQKEANLIISYHPPIFMPLKSLTQRTWKERIVVRCIENRIAVFSPHTSYDALAGGINDWLISAFGKFYFILIYFHGIILQIHFIYDFRIHHTKLQFVLMQKKSFLLKVRNRIILESYLIS